MADDSTKTGGWTTEEAVALIAAIRTFTVDAPHGRPNGKTESEILRLGDALRDGKIAKARRHFGDMCHSLAADTKALRVAADGLFGGDFRKPGGAL